MYPQAKESLSLESQADEPSRTQEILEQRIVAKQNFSSPVRPRL
jgi:hypothetical protein